jgi:hypothetical protein
MALSPSIPTSFVPKQPISPQNRPFSTGGNNVLLITAVVILVLTLLIAAGTFLYVLFLQSEENAKGQQVITAQKSVDQNTVDQLVRLQKRLDAATAVMDQHVELSQFFTLLSSITAQGVYFNGITVEVADDRSATITMTGVAQDFNTLAYQSNVFASQKYIKSAIFSNIAVNKGNTVSFSLTANLDPAIVIESTAPQTPQAAPVTTAPQSSSAAPVAQTSTTTHL